MAPGGGGFGQQSQPSLFGAPASAPAAGGFSFGGATAAAASTGFSGAPAASTGFGFGGAPSATASAGFGFGGAPVAASGASLFGAPAAASGSSLFGVPANGVSTFSGAAAASAPSLFGGMAASQPGTGGLFGAAATQPSPYGGGGFQQQQQQAAAAPVLTLQQQQQQHQLMQQQSLGVVLPVRLNTLMQRLDTRHADSPFHTALYNVVPPSDVSRYQRPAGMLESVFDEAILRNPDASCLVPVQANGFDDLLRRTELQNARCAQHAEALAAVEASVSRIEDSVTTELDTKLAAYRRSHRELARKLLALACRVERRACGGDTDPSLSAAEVGHRRRLDALLRSLAAPAEFKDKLSDVAEAAAAAAASAGGFDGGGGGGGRGGGGAAGGDARSLHVVRDLLQEQLTGIAHLGDVCRRSGLHLGILEVEIGARGRR